MLQCLDQVLYSIIVNPRNPRTARLWKLYLTGGRSSRSIGGGMPGAGGPGGRNVFSIGKAFAGRGISGPKGASSKAKMRRRFW